MRILGVTIAIMSLILVPSTSLDEIHINIHSTDAQLSQDTWTEIFPSPNPGLRRTSAWALDTLHNVIVLYGGVPGTNETWVYHLATKTWEQKFPAVFPPSRSVHTMIFDKKSGLTVLFGGYRTSHMNELNDTWVYDVPTNTWRELHPAHSPDPRHWPGLAYDDKNQEIVLFGGHDNIPLAYPGAPEMKDDTWLLDVSSETWTQVFPTKSPSARQTSLIYNQKDGFIYAFGGKWEFHTLNGVDHLVYMNDIWRYDVSTNTWSLVKDNSTLGDAPEPRRTKWTYDPINNIGILFGGGQEPTIQAFGDTWIYDFNTGIWTNITAATSPPARYRNLIIYDPVNNNTLLYGGNNPLIPKLYGDFWEFVRPIPPSISINSVSNATPRWGLDQVTVSGTVSNALGGDTIRIDWGDGVSTNGILPSGTSWGPVSHTYDAAHVGTNQIVTKLLDNANNAKATSASSSINVQKHATSFKLNSILAVKWGKSYTLTGLLTDTDAGIGIGGKALTFDGTAETDGGSITDAVTVGDGTFLTTGVAPNIPSTGRTVQGHFVGDTAYGASDSNIVKFNVIKRSASLTLRDIDVKDVPWGRPTSFPVTLTDRDNSGAGIQGASISFNGSGVMGVLNQVTDVNGKASGTGTAPNMTVACGFTVQARYVGNSLYLAANSLIRDYCTLKHDTMLGLFIAPASVAPGGTYKAGGVLKDRTTLAPLSSKTVSFTATSPIAISDKITDLSGAYTASGLTAPSTAGSYTIQALFAGDSLYNAKSSPVVTLTVS